MRSSSSRSSSTREHGREQGLEQFLDEKRIKPGLQTYERSAGD